MVQCFPAFLPRYVDRHLPKINVHVVKGEEVRIFVLFFSAAAIFFFVKGRDFCGRAVLLGLIVHA